MSTGVQGPRGIVGLRGPTGPTGPQGITGPSGSSDTPTNVNVVAVSNDLGSDITGTVGDLQFPFQTVDAAVAALAGTGNIILWKSEAPSLYTLNVVATGILTFSSQTLFDSDVTLDITVDQIQMIVCRNITLTLPENMNSGIDIESCTLNVPDLGRTLLGTNSIVNSVINSTFAGIIPNLFIYGDGSTVTIKNCIFNIVLVDAAKIIHDTLGGNIVTISDNFYRFTGTVLSGGTLQLYGGSFDINGDTVSFSQASGVGIVTFVLGNAKISNDTVISIPFQQGLTSSSITRNFISNLNHSNTTIQFTSQVLGTQTTRYGVLASAGLGNNYIDTTATIYDVRPVDDTIYASPGVTQINIYNDSKTLGKRIKIVNATANIIIVLATGITRFVTTTSPGNTQLNIPIGSMIELVYSEDDDTFYTIFSSIIQTFAPSVQPRPTEPNPWIST